MDFKTQRIRDYKPVGRINSQQFKHSTEYLVLAVLKLHMPLKFKNVKLSERPDIQLDGLGVEVTIADEREAMKVNNEFSKYCQGNNKEQRKKTIEKDGKYKIGYIGEDTNQIPVLQSGGGVDFNKYLLIIKRRIEEKTKSIEQYDTEYNRSIELAIVQRDRIPGNEYDKLAEYILKLLCGSSIISMVYYVDNQYLICIDIKSREWGKMNHGEYYENLSKMARMTAEGIITLNDVEWLD